MKWYFASRTKHIEKLKIVTSFLKEKGEQVYSDWIYSGVLSPYDEHVDEVLKLNQDVLEAINTIDIFVLISDQEGTDMFIELGIALGRHKNTEAAPKMYVVGPYAKRSLMLRNPLIIHVADLQEVFTIENIPHEGIAIPSFHE